jgi:DNA-directed RNA polymerase subunit omega
MARITVEDCIKQINNQYELVILAKERAVQLGRGAAPAVDPENDKKTSYCTKRNRRIKNHC